MTTRPRSDTIRGSLTIKESPSLIQEKIDALLDRVQKPARYTGGEMNCIVKPWDGVDIRYAFAFPDVYEVGM